MSEQHVMKIELATHICLTWVCSVLAFTSGNRVEIRDSTLKLKWNNKLFRRGARLSYYVGAQRAKRNYYQIRSEIMYRSNVN